MATEKNNTKNIILILLLLVAVAAGAFYGGVTYQKSKSTNQRSQFAVNANGRFGQGGPNGQRGTRFGGAVIGEVVSMDEKSLTVKMMDGSSKLINLSNTTTYNKSTEGKFQDITTGTRVAVFGTPDSDGSVTATNVSINPMMRFNAPTGTQNK